MVTKKITKRVKTVMRAVPADQIKELEAYAKIRGKTLFSADHIECVIGAHYEILEERAGNCKPIRMN